MEKSNIWLGLALLGVLTVFFFVAYFTMSSKTKTPSLQSLDLEFETTPFHSLTVKSPTYVVDSTYHPVVPAPQISTVPAESVIEPMSLPTTPLSFTPRDDVQKAPQGDAPPSILPFVEEHQSPRTMLSEFFEKTDNVSENKNE